MRTTLIGSHWDEHMPLAFETGLDEAIEFHFPEQSLTSCRFSLGDHSELVLEIKGFVAGEAQCPIELESAVESLLESLVEEPAETLEEEVDDIATIRALAQRFQSVGARLFEEAKKREDEIFRA